MSVVITCVLIPREVIRFLGPYQDRLEGSNDSEIYFWQFRKFYDLYGNVPAALEACVKELWTIWEFLPKSRKQVKWKAPYVGLNTLVAEGDSLHALCHFPAKHPKLSLYNPKVQWGRMSFARRGDRVILASEELDRNGWKQFGNPEIVSAVVEGGKVALKRRSFDPKPS